MLIDNKIKDHVSFFSNSSIVQSKENASQLANDPKPFGLNYQEAFAAKGNAPEQGVTMGSSPTNTPSGSDGCLDMDYEF